ncbi:putative receptor-like serine/threonine-protein kinase [Nymphaea thermarum]|nr:putative receptor-like serine/threonine-protein kinase [Nymphaea thermarum]
MTRMGNSEEQEEESGGAGAGGKTVLVGVNLDSESKELLTWALVKVAQPGDRVIALHVLKDPVEGRSGGKSSVVCLVNTFDSVISVYEGFCNLKQVDLKVKISRGSSLRKTLVQEAKEFGALTVIIGVTKSTRLGSSVSVARYCARQLSHICSVLAVSNGKVLFKREASGEKCRGDLSRRARIFGVIHRTLAKSPKSMSSGSDDASTNEGSGKNSDFEACSESGDSPHCCCKASSGSTDLASSTNIHEDSLATADALELNIQRKICQICMMDLHGQKPNNGSGDHDKKGFLAYEPYASDSSSTEDHNNPLELPPSLKLEAASSSMSLLMREMPELRSGWPHLRRKILPKRRTSDSMKQIPVVQWAAQLPSRYTAALSSKSSPVNTNTSTAAIDKVHASIGGKESDQFGDAEGELQKDYHKELQIFCEKHASTCKLFSYEELASATSQFSAENLIGNGGNSRVYRGHLSDGKELAIKILKPSDDAWKEFILEIEIVTSVKHENIVSLVGCCFRGSKFLLVYNFVPGGSLEESLHGSKGKALSWTERCKVAIGVAKALDYLHNENSHPIVHRDVKSSNVLLSEAFEPQLSDFGLAKWASTAAHITSSDVAGTFGYLAPEYFMYGKINSKIDVYSFGVLLLELLSRRKPISNEYPKGQESLVMWAMPFLQKGEFAKVLDPGLGQKYDAAQMHRMMLAASMCLRRSPHLRPEMGVVLKLLQGDEDTTKWAESQINATSEEFDGVDDESFSTLDIQSCLDLALLDVDDDSLSICSMDPSFSFFTKNSSLEDYLRTRGNLSASFG